MKRWDLIAVMERQQREYEALAIFHGRTPAGIDRMKRSLRRKVRYARGELQQRVWGELCRRTGCKAPCMGDNFIVRRLGALVLLVMAMAACNPSPPLSLAEQIKKDCAEVAALLTHLPPKLVEVTRKNCIETLAAQFIEGR
jgi:hypothetical protein